LLDSLKFNSPNPEDVLKINSDNLSTLRPASLPKIPPNPSTKTNQKLENIEKRLDQLCEVAIGAAGIANSLQGAAAEFLVKFETAAQDNNNAATKAIWLGAMAVFATLVVALVPIAYNEYFRVPAESKAMQAAIVEMKLEFTALREQQNNDINGLVEALNKSEDNLADAILQLKKLLSEKERQKGS